MSTAPDDSRPAAGFPAGELVEPGCWRALGSARFGGRPALFLDRDGVVVEEVEVGGMLAGLCCGVVVTLSRKAVVS